MDFKFFVFFFSFFNNHKKKLYKIFCILFHWNRWKCTSDIGFDNDYILKCDINTKILNPNRYTLNISCSAGIFDARSIARCKLLCELTYNLTKRDDIKRQTKPKLDHFFQWSRWNLIAAASSLLLPMPPPTITIRQSIGIHYSISLQDRVVTKADELYS